MSCHLRRSAGVKQFASFNWPNIVSANGDKSHRPSTVIDKLDLVAKTTSVNMHHGSHVSTIQFSVRRVAVQYHKRMFGNH
jgi:hypothetical protein